MTIYIDNSNIELSAAEQHKLLIDWNNTQTDYPKDKCIHQLFEAQVERTPNAIAVVFEDQQLTYHELNCRANQLAHHLQSLDVEPEVLVGICVERSLEMVVGLLAILKAGSAYVPLSPSYPKERLAFMLADAEVPILLTQEKLVENLPEHQAQIVCLETENFSKENPISEVTPENLAYVIYTSGSTGKPKGVLIPHQGLLNLVFWHQQAFNVTEKDKSTQLASLAFDAHVWELWPYLSAGASIYLLRNETLKSPVALQKWLIENKITLSFIPTPLVEELLRLKWPKNLALRMMLTGGDQLHHFPPTELSLVNNYGPTENTVVTTSGLVIKNSANQLPHIGRPIANTQIYLLDKHQRLVPIGMTGELHISGASLARGYLNRPDLTAEKFIKNPFSEEPGSRLYKTGDLARYLPDGNIEYLGRLDNQVKIRGFRIELGEIETVLLQHAAVQQAIVIVWEVHQDDKRLAAYIIPNRKPAPTPSELHHFLKKQLPDYMVPTAFIMLEKLPLTPNGKIDRNALPDPEKRYINKELIPPRTPIEQLLTTIWAEVLGGEQVGVHDDFFELGGHSLLATQILSRLRERFGVEISLAELFETPTIAGLAQYLNNDSRPSPAIPAISRQQNLPLSSFQEPLWLLAQMNPEIPLYNESAAIHINSTLNVAALELSLNAIIKRHEILRTTFTMKNGQTVQNIISSPLPFVDLRKLPNEKRQAAALNLANEQAKRLFDLTQVPLVRAILVQIDEAQFRLFVTLHHIIIDGFSLYNLFMPELISFYKAFSTTQSSPLPELPIQYADFATWQRQQTFEAQLSYWKMVLGNNPPRLQLPTDYPRPATPTFQGAKQHFTLSQSLTTKLKLLNQQEGVTLFMTLLATFNTLLYRYTGQDDLVIGSFADCHDRSELEPVMGYFLNPLVLRTDMSGNPTFKQLLARVREVTIGAYSHHDLPFQQLVEALKPTRAPGQNPFFEVALTLEPPVKSLDSDWKLCQYDDDIDTDTAKFELSIEFEERTSDIIARIEYRTDLFEKATIERMIGHFQTLLEGIVANPLEHISELPLLTKHEQHQLVQWNDTQIDYPKDKCIHQLFEAQVESTPEAVAVRFEDQQLTYRELNKNANQLAYYLQTLGVKPEVLVGICVERTIEMVIGLLGILKAGGAYVPIEPNYPLARIRYMLEDSTAPLLLTQSHLKAQLSELEHESVVVYLDEVDLANQPTENPLSNNFAKDLAYVIYTSGSTGKPKGVMIEHFGAVNLATFQHHYFHTNTDSRILQFASLSFDAATWEVLMSLCSGATLQLVPMSQIQTDLTDILQKQAITHATLPPSVLNVLSNSNLSHLKYLIVAGEACSPELVRQWTQPGRHFINAYGPTETTVCASVFECTPDGDKPPIGQSIANTRIYILDKNNQPLPPSIPGELCIAGDGLARGYLNRPELTAEKFIEVELFGKTERIYKTGDLAKWLPDGNLEYLGRIDHQVKLRGFRIELGEIEATLIQHENVKEAVVILQTDNPRLVAYVTLAIPIDEVTGVLRTWLRARLPEYMLPASFTVLDKLPLTPNGKIDRNSKELSGENFIAPRSHKEKRLADIWCQVLGIDKIGIHDNFFELGGHSLQAVQLVSKISLATNIEISVKQLFLYPTIAQLATTRPAKRKNHSIGELIMSSAHFQLERRSLLSLLAAKKIPPVNAAALGYLPDSILEQSDLSREEMLEQWVENLPLLAGITETAWGRIALLLLPRFNSELYGDTNDIVEVTLEALEIAGHLDATTVSLTGIIPSATDYGRAITKAMTARPHLPQITTGHSTTTAAVVLAIQKILQEGGREMTTERVGVIGLGSIGLSSLRLMLKCLPHPAELMLCDLYAKKAFLEQIREQIISELCFQGNIQLLFSEVELPKEIYKATLIVGATNVPDILDINLIKPGTLIVDDSGPHCFKTELAIKRFQAHQDILFTEGGVLKSPQPVQTVIYLPRHLENSLSHKQQQAFIKLIKHNPFEITGCVFSSVLSSVEKLKPLVGLVQLNDSVKHYETLKAKGFQAADLHCEDYVLPEAAINDFRIRFGH
jgi:amino acid adenylation domain-containing protein